MQTLQALGAAVVAALVFGLAGALVILVWAVAIPGRPPIDPFADIVVPWLRIGFRLGLTVGLPGTLTIALARVGGGRRGVEGNVGKSRSDPFDTPRRGQ